MALDIPADEDGLPAVRDPRRPISPPARKQIVKELRISVRKHGTFELACQSAGISLELLQSWMAEDPHLEAKLIKDRADCQAEMLTNARDQNLSPAHRKQELEMLSRLDKAWAPRSRTTLVSQLQDGFAALKKVVPLETYELVVATIETHG